MTPRAGRGGSRGKHMQTEEELYEFFKRRKAEGAKWKDISAEANVPIRRAEAIWSKMRKREVKVVIDGPPCLRCKKPFRPETKFNKMCPRCKVAPAWLAA
jgi:hypothetical protein